MEKRQTCPCHCDIPSASRRDFLLLSAAAGIGMILPDSHAQVQSIHELQGTAFRNREPITLATQINFGDQVTVSHGSGLTFSIGQDVYRLRGGTSLKLEAGTGLHLLTGALLGNFGREPKTIYTRSAIIRIRDAAFYLDSRPAETYFCTCYGETEVQLAGLGKETYAATHHKPIMIYTPDGEKPSIQAMAEPERHTDDELRKNESYAGRTVPFDA